MVFFNGPTDEFEILPSLQSYLVIFVVELLKTVNLTLDPFFGFLDALWVIAVDDKDNSIEFFRVQAKARPKFVEPLLILRGLVSQLSVRVVVFGRRVDDLLADRNGI